VNEREREAILAANFLPYALTVMRGRRGCAQAKPASAYKAYLGVRKAHSKRSVELPGTKLVWQMCKRLNAKHAADFGALSLVVKRKQPFTKEILHALLISTDKGALDLTVPAVAAVNADVPFPLITPVSVVAPDPPLPTATVPVTLEAVPVVF
jgi:hypothetical protein